MRARAGTPMNMAARMNPHLRHDLTEFAPEDHDAQIINFPVSEWDRLELWARRESVKQDAEMRARNAALSRI